MEKLIKKLEAANGGSYYLDKEISEQREPGAICFPNYTRSIDAALTLVPEGMIYHLTGRNGLHHACIARDNPGDKDHEDWIGPLKNPALAICTAALKA